MFRLLFELNRRMPNGTYGGVRGIINLYSIVLHRTIGRIVVAKAGQERKKHAEGVTNNGFVRFLKKVVL